MGRQSKILRSWYPRTECEPDGAHRRGCVPNPINGQVSNKLESKVASPKKLKNPTTSVTVVSTMDED